MAGTQGTVVVFDSYLEHIWDSGYHNFGGTPNALYCAIVNAGTTLATTTADPHWNGTGTTNLQANEQTGGSYTANGFALATPTATLNAGTLEVDFGDPATWSQNASNPTTCDYGVIYDSTDTNKKCIGYVELGTQFDATTGDLTISWGAPFHTVNQA